MVLPVFVATLFNFQTFTCDCLCFAAGECATTKLVASCRSYTCITGDPSAAQAIAGATLPSSVCSCTGSQECSVVSSSNFSASQTGASPVLQASTVLSGVPGSRLHLATFCQSDLGNPLLQASSPW